MAKVEVIHQDEINFLMKNLMISAPENLVEVIHQDEINLSNEIEIFFHCGKCLDEKPDDLSPREFGSIEVGITKDGDIQVWCKRHEVNVNLITFKVK